MLYIIYDSFKLRTGLKGRVIAAWMASLFLMSNNQPLFSDEAFEFFEEEAVVISAAKYLQKISAAPASASVITAEEIERYGYRTLGEALQSVPGFYVTNDRNYSYLWVRGFGRPGDYNSRVLTLIDGHRINENIYGGSFPGHDFGLDMKSIERIEIVKGPGSALYGDSAFFAVVNVIPKKPQRDSALTASAEGGSHGTHKEFMSLENRFSNELNLYTAGSYRKMRGQDLFYPEFETVNNGLAQNTDREENYTFYTSLARAGFTLHGNANNRKKKIPTGAFETTFNNPMSETSDSRNFIELQMDRKLKAGPHLAGRVYHDWYRYQGNYLHDNETPPPPTLLEKDSAAGRWVGEEFRIHFEAFGKGNTLLLGQEFEKNLEGRQRNFIEEPFELSVNDNQKTTRSAFFIQQEVRPHPTLSLTLGLRHDRYKSFGTTWNPRTAAVYQPWKMSALKLIYGTAFRAPAPYEMFYEGIGSKKNLQLEPEKVTTHEIHWEQYFPNRSVASLGFFQNRVRNLIRQGTDPADDLLQYVNDENIRSRGMEIASKWNLSPSFSGTLGYTLQSTKKNGGSRLSNSPQHSGSCGISKSLWNRKASLSLSTVFQGKRRTVNDTPLSAATVHSLNVSLKPWTNGPRLYSGVYNLTNVKYSVSGNEEHIQDSIEQDRRNLTLGLEYQFGPSSTPRP